MNTMQTSGKRPGLPGVLVWALVVLCCVTAVSSQSFWIDEALTGVKAAQPTLADWARKFFAERASDLQMPLYMFMVWAHAQIFGASEVALRAFNVPWLLLGALAFARSCSDRKQAVAGLLALAACPFAWYYLNEARPYAMMLGASLMVLASLRVLGRGANELTPKWFAVFCFALVALAGGSLIGMVWAAGAIAMLVILRKGEGIWSLIKPNLETALIATTLLGVLGAFYLWTLTLGARASAVSGTSWRNVAFVFYELAGFSGFGPGRTDLRTTGIGTLGPFLPGLTAYGLVAMCVVAEGLRVACRAENRSRLFKVTLCLFAPFIFVLSAGVVLHWRVLGRHFTPLAAVCTLLATLGISSLWSPPVARVWRRGIVIAFLLLSFASGLSLRFAPRHARDDYRGAAQLARAAVAQGQTVWWNAAREGAEYYALPFSNEPNASRGVVTVLNPTPSDLAALARPAVVITSKPDLFDNAGAVAAFLGANHFRLTTTLTAFQVWQAPD